MKKHYEMPTAEKLAFRYRDQVVAASGAGVDNGVKCTVQDTKLMELGSWDICGFIGGQFGIVGAEV